MHGGDSLPDGSATGPVTASRTWLLDLLCLALLAVFWAYYVTPIVVHEQRHGGDIFRDAASAMNIAHGHPFADPAYRGETAWYPLLSPAIVAGVSSLLDVEPLDCYRWSQLLFNWLIPAGLYLLVRLAWGWRAAAAASVALLLAIPWWQCEVVQGQPSVHAVVWGWAALLIYAKQQRSASLGWAAACGLFQGIAFWHHPLIPTLLTGTFVLQAVWAGRRRDGAPGSQAPAGRSLIRHVLIAGISFLVAAPILFFMLRGPVLNHVPREFIAPELRTFEFALLRGNPWIWGTGLVGLIVSFRRADLGSRLLVWAVALSVAGQVVSYPRVLGWGWAAGLPLIVPHEFQWSFQLGWAVCVGVGIDYLLTVAAGRWSRLKAGSLGAGLLTLVALAVTGAWGLPRVKENLRRFAHVYVRYFPEATAWVRQNTDINDVFACHPTWAFTWLNAQTGRKVWLTEPGQSNPRVAWKWREDMLRQLMAAPTPHDFWRLARELEVDYCIFSPEWMPHIMRDPVLQRLAIPAYLEVAYPGAEDEPAILRVRPVPAAKPDGR